MKPFPRGLVGFLPLRSFCFIAVVFLSRDPYHTALVVGCKNGTLHLFHHKNLTNYPRIHQHEINSIVWDPSGSRFLTGDVVCLFTFNYSNYLNHSSSSSVELSRYGVSTRIDQATANLKPLDLMTFMMTFRTPPFNLSLFISLFCFSLSIFTPDLLQIPVEFHQTSLQLPPLTGMFSRWQKILIRSFV